MDNPTPLQVATASEASPIPDNTAALRSAMVDGRITIAETAAAFRVTERSVYNAIDRYRVPFVKVFGVRYLRPEDLRKALIAAETNSPPRRRGRPRSTA